MHYSHLKFFIYCQLQCKYKKDIVIKLLMSFLFLLILFHVINRFAVSYFCESAGRLGAADTVTDMKGKCVDNDKVHSYNFSLPRADLFIFIIR